MGIKYLTLYAFSKENWKRPKKEVNTLMDLFVTTVSKELETLNKNNIRLEAIGDLDSLPTKTHNALKSAMQSTAGNDHMTLVLALNYSSRWEIMEAVKKIAGKVKDQVIDPEDITEEHLTYHLTTQHIPDPELMIRTSGENRISNFLLWQLSYAELVFNKTMWPDFGKEELYNCILEYQRRERRFGMTGEQESVSNHKMRLLVALVGIFSIFNLGAQTDRPYQELDYNNPQEYQIAEVKVVGTESRDKNAIKSITGLREGESVRIPSNELTDGIKKLWSLGIFADVTLVLDKIESDSVYLTIELLEQPILSRIVFDGVNKTKQDKLQN